VVRRDRIDLLQRQAGRCAACKSVFEPDLEQGGNTNVVVRREPAFKGPELDPGLFSKPIDHSVTKSANRDRQTAICEDAGTARKLERHTQAL
jgi:hypothetical protein